MCSFTCTWHAHHHTCAGPVRFPPAHGMCILGHVHSLCISRIHMPSAWPNIHMACPCDMHVPGTSAYMHMACAVLHAHGMHIIIHAPGLCVFHRHMACAFWDMYVHCASAASTCHPRGLTCTWHVHVTCTCLAHLPLCTWHVQFLTALRAGPHLAGV